ncbi:hypothetical protein PoB_002631700 [Plakobranchus ocellatus]|uniref:Uncharacterized protein n=1 Tax=Plakobranchus ocellatus TaxID=259542 RepID=A0AAV3ZXK7_9GAST|nr:hypothetical protein PoB_002631700 [Plakobranchus ocellatus]
MKNPRQQRKFTKVRRYCILHSARFMYEYQTRRTRGSAEEDSDFDQLMLETNFQHQVARENKERGVVGAGKPDARKKPNNAKRRKVGMDTLSEFQKVNNQHNEPSSIWNPQEKGKTRTQMR